MLLASVPVAIFRLIRTGASSPLHPEEVLALCATYIPICWQLYFEGGLTEVQQILPGYLTQLSVLAEKPSPYQKQAASLASKAYQLATCIEMHQHRPDTALTQARFAIEASQTAEDVNLQVASLIQQANVYFSFRQQEQELQTYQTAMQLSNNVSPLLKGRVAIGLAKAHAHFKQEQEAIHFLEMAHEHYPEHPEDDSNFHYTCHSRFTLTNHTGLTYLLLGMPQYLEKAWTIFADIDHTVPTIIVPRRVELSVRQATASFALDDMKKTCAYLEAAVAGAKVIGSPFRYQEAFELYRRMRKRWRNERPVRALKTQFQQ